MLQRDPDLDVAGTTDDDLPSARTAAPVTTLTNPIDGVEFADAATSATRLPAQNYGHPIQRICQRGPPTNHCALRRVACTVIVTRRSSSVSASPDQHRTTATEPRR